MSLGGILAGFSRLSLVPTAARSISTCIYPLCIRTTDALLGEPLKKKKRIDPAIIRQREDRKRRKLEKAIRRLLKHSRQLKPLKEVEIPYKLLDEKKERQRPPPVSAIDSCEDAILLMKNWTRYKRLLDIEDLKTIDRIVESQERALDELREESEQLYQAAIQLDESLLPYGSSSEPAIVHTPPLANYTSPDGEYSDVTVRYEGEKDLIQ